MYVYSNMHNLANPFLWKKIHILKNKLSQSGGQERISTESLAEENKTSFVELI